MNTVATTYTCSDAFLIEIIGGLHQGAQQSLSAQQALLLGSKSDCDVILSDDGIAEHHCLIGLSGSGCWLRPMEASITINNKYIVAPGETIQLQVCDSFAIGGAQIRYCSLAEEKASKQTKKYAYHHLLRQKHFRKACVLVLLLLAGGAIAGFSHQLPKQEFNVSVPSKVSRDTSKNHELNLLPSNDQSHKQMASNVREILRLSGLKVEALYLSEGQVAVTGYLGNGQAIAAIIQSRAIRDIRGLNKVIVHNLDAPKISSELGAGKRITSVMAGSNSDFDSYIVTDDGARYYLGAILPNGGKLTAIENEKIIVQSLTGKQRIASVGAWLNL